MLLTNIGIAKLANATALNQPLKITHMVVGDSNGVVSHPDIKQTSLINECYRAQLNSLSRDETNHNQIIAEMVIPDNIGGWYIREAGLLDEHGDLIAVANTPESYKPQLQEGSGRSQIIRMVLVISNTTSVELKIDSSVVLASRQYVEQLIKQHANSDNHPTATTSKKGMVILSNAVDSKSETTAATSASIQTAIAKSRQYSEQLIKQHASSDNHPTATTSKKGMVILSNAVDSKSETIAATSAAINKVFTQAVTANTNANNRVPLSRKINGYPLSSDISITAENIGALTMKAFSGQFEEIGYQRLPSGLIIQWGSYSGSDKTFNFPIPFTKFCVVARSGQSRGDANYDLDIKYTLTTFSVSHAYQHNIIAIGI